MKLSRSPHVPDPLLIHSYENASLHVTVGVALRSVTHPLTQVVPTCTLPDARAMAVLANVWAFSAYFVDLSMARTPLGIRKSRLAKAKSALGGAKIRVSGSRALLRIQKSPLGASQYE